jgi:AraC family transcriptional regulator
MVLDDSKVSRAEAHSHAGAVVEHRRFGGARVVRIMHPPHQHIAAHDHDWPVLAIYRFGDYRERAGDGEEETFDGPSFVLQPSGAAHEDMIGASGLETLSLTFDPAWLSPQARAVLPRVTHWRPGGAASMAARELAQVWLSPRSEAELMAATSSFLVNAIADEAPRVVAPNWGGRALAELAGDAPSTDVIAQRLALHPAWLARAYRAWRGEGMAETVRRKRVEQAALRLRGGAAPLADIAADVGFCDQSHMNRAFRAVLGRTPLEVRREAALLAPLGA